MTSSLWNRTLGQEEQRRPFPSLPESQLKALVRESYHFRAHGRKGQRSFLALTPSTRFLCSQGTRTRVVQLEAGGRGAQRGLDASPPAAVVYCGPSAWGALSSSPGPCHWHSQLFYVSLSSRLQGCRIQTHPNPSLP